VNPVLNWVLGVLGPIMAGLAMWLLNRAVSRVDALELALRTQGDRLHQIDLQIAKELPTKEDFVDLKRDLQSVSATMHEVRDMVIRMEERNKSSG
jgi:hypothetical protein